MLFNSLEFLLFLPVVFALYWMANRWTKTSENLTIQNTLLLLASYVFYGWWDWRFLSLIAFSTIVDWFVGLQIHQANEADNPSDLLHRSRKARRWLTVSFVVNLGLLGYFKYANFFIENWVNAWATVGVTMHTASLQLILPVGISFYTFQTLSYSIDIYRRQLKPTRSILNFAAFVSFFPQLVAGPIERASALLPQIEKRRTFDLDLAVSGLRLIVLGMFKKVVVADNCAIFVNDIFNNFQDHSGPTLALSAICFAFQIYGDFSGYSYIAIGTARLFGLKLMTNFKMPYFSRDIAEFWRRWHISLSTWFRDYLYIPLGGSRGGKSVAVRNTFVIFLVSGFWHGANWTFVIWGLIHALLFLPLLLTGKNKKHRYEVAEGKWLPSTNEALKILVTFSLVTLAWVFFRAPDLHTAMSYLGRLPLNWPHLTQISSSNVFYIAAIILTEWCIRCSNSQLFRGIPPFFLHISRWSWYTLALWLIVKNFHNQADFIYFQF